MSTYREIHGKAIKSLSTDPSDDSVAGQIWYNTSSDTFKSVIASSAWSSSSPMITARAYLAGITGTSGQTTGLVFSGNTGAPGLNETNVTEEYNGSGWSSGGNVSTARIAGVGFGTQTAAVFTGGRTPPSKQVTTTENYNGTSWTSGGALGTARRYLSGAGTQTSGLAFGGTSGGAPGAGTAQSGTEEYNGTAWTGGGALGTARQSGTGTGASQTSAIYFGGGNNPSDKRTETYNGSAWTELAEMVTGASSAAGFGIESSAMRAGGATSTTSYVTNVEDWNGSSWAVNPATIASGTQGLVGQGSTTAGLIAGGWSTSSPPTTNASEEYNFTTNIITAAAWASGGTMPSPRLNGGQGIGTKTAAANFGGNTTSITYPYTTTTYEYDGSTWSGGGARSDAVSAGSAFGPLTAGVTFGGYQYPPNVSIDGTEEYDGSSWSEGGALGTSRYDAGGAGTLTAGMAIGGQHRPNPSPVRQSSVELYNGTAWTGGTALPTATNAMASGGTQTATIIAGGAQPPSPHAGNSYDFNGSSWTTNASPVYNQAKAYGSGGPTSQTDFLLAGGNVSPSYPSLVLCELFNGTTWGTQPSMAVARTGQKMNGQAASATTTIVAGGTPPPTGVNTSETFTAETTALNIKTLTQS